MMKGKLKRVFAVATAGVMAFSLAACGNSGEDSAKTEEKSEKKAEEKTDVILDQITLGEDYTDLEAELKFLTNRTDFVETTFKEYIEEFQKMYPNISIEYEGITDYANDVTTRLSTGDWGDICMIPTTVDKDELENYFAPFGSNEALSDTYDYLDNFRYGDMIYGMPSMATVQGIVYNKAVFEEAGVKELPTTPDEYLSALQAIKDNTDAIPLYTNFAADWTMTAWDTYIDGNATGDPAYAHEGRTKGLNPYSDRGDGTGPYAVYNVLYEAISQGLTEDDPTTTDWEGSKIRANEGEIASMVLGSWALPQIQGAGENGDDIAYMPFPVTVSGQQYTSVIPDYNYGINVNSSEDQKTAAMCYIKWLIEESGFAESEGGLSPKKGTEFPETLSAFEGVGQVVNDPAPEGEETLMNDVNNESELGITVSGAVPKEVVESAVDGSKTMEELSGEWNEKWSAAQEKLGVTPQEYKLQK